MNQYAQNRYARQIVLPEIGAKGQGRLLSARVAVVGAGGLGCPVLQYLAGAGVGKITIFDPERVEESNLHRQTLFSVRDIGQPKALSARARLHEAYPDIEIDAHAKALNPSNALGLIQTVDLVIDAADSYAVSYILSDICLAENVPLISASALGQAGYVGGFCAFAPSMRAVFPDLPIQNARCETAGIMGPVVGMIGAMQAQMALKVILDHTPSPLGKIFTLDMKKLTFGHFSFLNACEPVAFFPFISMGDIRLCDQLVDLRGKDEASVKISAHAQRLTMEKIHSLNIASPECRVILCCASGLRAWRAAAILHARGHSNLALLATSATE